MLDTISITYLAKENVSEIYALKGSILSMLNRSDDAQKAFSAALQLNDTQPKAWAAWGDHLESVYMKEK